MTGDHWLKQREITSLEAYLVSIQAKDFCPSFTNEILLKIRSMIDEINITSKDFKFTTAFRVDMALTASGHALGKFCKVFPRKHDPVRHFETDMKQKYMQIFKTLYTR